MVDHVLASPDVDTASISAPDEITKVEIEQVPDIPVVAKPTAKTKKPQVKIASEVVAPVSTPVGAWAVQLSSADTESSAWMTWKNLQAKHSVLKSEKPSVVRADLGSKGVFYRVRLGGFEDQAEAKKSCARLKSHGVSCFIGKSAS